MKLAPEVNLLAVAHYLEALDMQRRANQVVTILGSKTPNIQNLAVGGVANAINLDNQATLNMQKLYAVKDLLDGLMAFIEKVYFVDICAIGAMYADWFSVRAGRRQLPGGARPPARHQGHEVRPARRHDQGRRPRDDEADPSFTDEYFRDNVQECIAHSWYDGDWTRHPWEEDTVPKYSEFQDAGKYSWIKAPRFGGEPMQVGPLAQVLVGLAQKHEPTVRWATKTLEVAGKVAGTTLGPGILHSTLGRHAARMIRCAVIAEQAVKHWQLLVENIAQGRHRRSTTSRRSRPASSAASASTRPREGRCRTGW